VLNSKCSESEPLSLVKYSLHDNTLPCSISSVERAMGTVILPNYTLPCLWRFDLTFGNGVQGKSAGWNILDQTPIDSKFHNNSLLHQGFHTMGLRSNLVHEGISSSAKTFCH